MSYLWSIIVDSAQRSPWGWALLATVILGLIKVWPALSRQAMEERAKIRAEKRDDLGNCYARIASLRTEMDALKALVTSYHIKLNGTLIAYRILDVAQEIEHPGSAAAAEARAVLRAAFGGSELPGDLAELLGKVA